MSTPKASFSWVHEGLVSRPIGASGRGMFATKNIKEGALLAIFGGYVLPAAEEQLLPEDMRDYALQIHDEFVLGIKHHSEVEEACYFNHSCSPNAGIKGQIFLVALRGIRKADQACFDYAMVLGKSKGVRTYKIECLCGETNCRKYITDDDWQKPALQKRYKGFFQHFIQEKIDSQSKSRGV